ncbi:hypothetical protein ACVILK_007495 [Bradyrhizobium embrapense]
MIDFFIDTAGFAGSLGRVGAASRHPQQRRVDLADQARNIRGRRRIVAEIGRNDVCGQFDRRLA